MVTVHGIIFGLCFVAHPATNKTDDYIVGINPQGVIFQANACTGCRLSRNCDIIVLDNQLFVQLYNSAYSEYHGTFSGLLYGMTQCSWCVAVVERCYHINSTARTAGSIFTCTFGSRKGCNGGTVRSRIFGGAGVVRIRVSIVIRIVFVIGSVSSLFCRIIFTDRSVVRAGCRYPYKESNEQNSLYDFDISHFLFLYSSLSERLVLRE